MKRFLVLFMVLTAFAWSAPADAAFSDMWANVYRWSGGYNADGSPTVVKATSGIQYRVHAAGADTKETLYAYGDLSLTSKTNPVTATVFGTDGGQIAFRVDPTDSTNDRYVDLIVVDNVGGYTTVVRNFDKYTHSVIIDERPNVQHHGIIFYDHTTTASVNTGVYLSKHTFINGFVKENLVAAGGGAVSVGVSGASSALGYGTDAVVGYASQAANMAGFNVYAANSAWYFTTATTSIFATAQSAAGAAYYGNAHFWFTVVR